MKRQVPEKAPSETVPLSAPDEGTAPPLDQEPGGGRTYLFWWLALLVWVGAFLFLWGAEVIGLAYRVIVANPD